MIRPGDPLTRLEPTSRSCDGCPSVEAVQQLPGSGRWYCERCLRLGQPAAPRVVPRPTDSAPAGGPEIEAARRERDSFGVPPICEAAQDLVSAVVAENMPIATTKRMLVVGGPQRSGGRYR